jgi:hypothetical protein
MRSRRLAAEPRGGIRIQEREYARKRYQPARCTPDASHAQCYARAAAAAVPPHAKKVDALLHGIAAAVGLITERLY